MAISLLFALCVLSEFHKITRIVYYKLVAMRTTLKSKSCLHELFKNFVTVDRDHDRVRDPLRDCDRIMLCDVLDYKSTLTII
jgi:hypothetical protein